MNPSTFRSFILSVVKPPKSGKTVTQKDDGTASLDNLVPDGGKDDRFRMTSPFGSIAWVPSGITAFYQALFGGGFENLIVGYLHSKRPAPSAPGEHILYSTDDTGATVKVKLTLGADGTLTINAPVKVVVVAPEIDLGGEALEKVLNGETFQTFFNNHQHEGNLGSPTSGPIVPSDASHLSTVVKAAKS